MGPFQDHPVSWKGETYVIPARQVMAAIACAEDAITLDQMLMYVRRQKAPVVTLAMGYGRLLRFVGVQVSDLTVYQYMMDHPAEGEEMTMSLMELLKMLLPPALVAASMKQDNNRGNARKAATRLSRTRTKRRSGRAG